MDEYSILRKKQRKNAFAATSLLISIALALLVLVGAVLILGKVDNQKVNAVNDDSNVTLGSGADITCVGLTKEMVFDTNIRNIKEAAISYFTNERLPKNIGDTIKITLKEMQDKKIILNVIDASAKLCSSDETYVEVTKEKDEYVMKINLSCSDKEDYLLVHLGCYDYCDSNICEKKEETPKQYEYEYKKTTSCTMSDWSNWGNWTQTREKTSNLKKEDVKVETKVQEVVDNKNATMNVTYNCDNYPGYDLVGDKCVKETTITDIKNATPSKYSYNCDKYQGYSLVGTKCIMKTIVKDAVDASKNPQTYSCSAGYKLNGLKCEKTVSKTETIPATRTCSSGYDLVKTECKKTTSDIKPATRTCPSGYTLSGINCILTTTNTKNAEEVYSTRNKTEYYTCYKPQCTTKTIFQCPQGGTCGNYPETSCENVKKTCSRNVSENYVSGYKCEDQYVLSETKDGKNICTKTTTDTKTSTLTCPSEYTLSGTNCIKTTTDTKTSTLTCPSEYKLSGTQCSKTYQVTENIDAIKDPITYYCKTGYTLNGKKCTKEVEEINQKEATKVVGGYVCSEGYTQKDKTCTKVTVNKDIKDASKKVTYSCPVGYTKNDKTCTMNSTKTIKITYYRYATRKCNGGSTVTKWSTSNNDSILKNDGYKLTGNKREIEESIK